MLVAVLGALNYVHVSMANVLYVHVPFGGAVVSESCLGPVTRKILTDVQ